MLREIHVNFTWNERENVYINLGEKSSHTNFTWNSHKSIHNFPCKRFHVKIVWKSCEFSHEIHVIFYVKSHEKCHVNFTSHEFHMNVVWILHETSPEIHVKLFSRECHVRNNWLCSKYCHKETVHASVLERHKKLCMYMYMYDRKLLSSTLGVKMTLF